jgi:hypothetical protein
MTKLIGMMCVRDEADLLPEVYPHIRELVDELYVYEDGSVDETWSIVKDADYAIQRARDIERLNIYRPNYHHLLEKIKENYDLDKEDVWVIITMGDRFFLNKTPRQIVEEAQEAGHVSVEGIQLDFLRHRRDPWTKENDTFPVYSESVRTLCRWVKFDERCIVAYKATYEASYLKAKYPWPKNIGMPQYACATMEGKLSLGMPYLEHQGRRSPKGIVDRNKSGARPISTSAKYGKLDVSTWDAVVDAFPRYFDAFMVFPWVGNESLVALIHWENRKEGIDRTSAKNIFRGAEVVWRTLSLPERNDI